ncbi:MAG: pyruvate kinase [Planctomycetia bacterium]|nr:pyruvate kinase [Planctomycetia bacterium]
MSKETRTFLERPSRTKIVATLGPASNNEEILPKLLYAGVDVFRINAAHGTQEEFASTLKRIRKVAKKTGFHVATLMDLGGPKIRLGQLPNDALQLAAETFVAFVAEALTTEGAPETLELKDVPLLTCTYAPLVEELDIDDRVVLADGTVELRVVEKSPENLWAKCRVLQGGAIRSRQGVNLPGVKLSIPAMLDVDRSNAAWAAKNGIDFIGLSFVRQASEILELKKLIADNNGVSQVVAKIEKPEAVENLEEIVQVADAVMVARGDLGVETDIAAVPILQKRIISLCHEYKKPVIVATQMLESMTHSNMPTRAEVNDVANAILDGADACMLSGESAVGDFPVETVEMMHRIALSTEDSSDICDGVQMDSAFLDPLQEAAADAACYLAGETGAKYILAATGEGHSALALSTQRCSTRILALTHSEETLRRMNLYWGVIPILLPKDKVETRDIMKYAVKKLRAEELILPGDCLVLLTGMNISATNNAIVVFREKEKKTKQAKK